MSTGTHQGDVLAEASIKTMLTGIRMPRMNSIMERWVQSCRHELLDRYLLWTNATCGTPNASTNTSTTTTESPPSPGPSCSTALY
ncbi:Mobile element protein [[Actinomadura] parvosata subsp. kistnae]|uniref:hypothetical protein n=1 Tax=[Actinomadura] parvosata TaxID=1955412 RepID=UPI000D286923|nr:hypothetical protein [Nonomuraea sp. ATCC 55076]SPL91903.1 Mobile element protein [Actinomadura parvosata subsp. kistnae]